MRGMKSIRQLVLLLATGLLMPAGASAGPIWNWLNGIPPDCSAGDYPIIHYWANNVWNAKAHCFGVKGEPVSMYSTHCLPVEPRFYIRPTHCPYEDPYGLSDWGRAAPEIAVATVASEGDIKPDRLPETTPDPRPLPPAQEEEK
jgi:hypothetical protein